METPKVQITLSQLPIGSRLMVRSRLDWRFAAVSKVAEERIVLTVCSPTGRTYRLRREFDAAIEIDGNVPVLVHDEKEDWRENFTRYDGRW
ncbi:MAG: hypothetical protein AB7J13_13290 [Pyrinomonadaceae bacterium]